MGTVVAVFSYVQQVLTEGFDRLGRARSAMEAERNANVIVDQTRWRDLLVIEAVRPEEFPRMHRTCYCDGFRTGYDVSPHVVQVEVCQLTVNFLPLRGHSAEFEMIRMLCSGIY